MSKPYSIYELFRLIMKKKNNDNFYFQQNAFRNFYLTHDLCFQKVLINIFGIKMHDNRVL